MRGLLLSKLAFGKALYKHFFDVVMHSNMQTGP